MTGIELAGFRTEVKLELELISASVDADIASVDRREPGQSVKDLRVDGCCKREKSKA